MDACFVSSRSEHVYEMMGILVLNSGRYVYHVVKIK